MLTGTAYRYLSLEVQKLLTKTMPEGREVTYPEKAAAVNYAAYPAKVNLQELYHKESGLAT